MATPIIGASPTAGRLGNGGQLIGGPRQLVCAAARRLAAGRPTSRRRPVTGSAPIIRGGGGAARAQTLAGPKEALATFRERTWAEDQYLINK